jgi:hypothetical protein
MITDNLGKALLDKTLVIVLAHPNDDHKTQILNDCLSTITFPKLLSCNYELKEDTQKLCDWILYSKENPILYEKDFAKYDIFLSRWFLNEIGEKVYLSHKFDNQYAVSFLIKNALSFAKHLKKEFIHIVNYDFNITDEILIENTLELIENNLIVYMCPPHAFNRPACSTAFFSGKTLTIEKFFNQFNSIDQYYFYKNQGLFLEEKFYTHMKLIESNIKEKDLDGLSTRCNIARHAIVADFIYD